MRKTTLPALLILLGLPFAAGPAFSAPQAKPVTLDQALKNLASFQAGIDSAAYWKFREAVLALRDDPAARAAGEKKLLAFLQTKAPIAAKTAVCRELRIIGGPASIPALERYLLDKNMSDPARYALEEINDPSVDRALLKGLEKAAGPVQIGLISSLGFRRTAAAAGPLGKIVGGRNAGAAAAAIHALGRIGGNEAVAAFRWALKAQAPEIRSAALSAALECAEGFLKAGNAQTAAVLYEAVLAVRPDAAIRRAAAIGKISASGEKASRVLLDFLRGEDEVVQEAALAKIKDVIPADGLEPLGGLLPLLPEGSRVKLLAALSGYPKERSLPIILKSLQSGSVLERIAAFKALATAGDASVIQALASGAVLTKGEEQASARASLALVKGRDADEAVLKLLGTDVNEAVKAELIQAVGERRIFSGKSALTGQLDGSSPRLRIQALKVLKVIGTPSDIPALLNHLERAADDAEREETENTAAALAAKISQPIGRSNAVLSRLRAESDPVRKAGLIRILAKIGDDSSLPDLRLALTADAGVRDAAVRAMAGWPSATPVEDVVRLAKTASEEAHRLLALRGFIRMTALGKFRIRENAVADLRSALEMSRRPDEKRLVLAALADFACLDALKLAQSLLGDPDVAAEAQAAVSALQKKMK